MMSCKEGEGVRQSVMVGHKAWVHDSGGRVVKKSPKFSPNICGNIVDIIYHFIINYLIIEIIIINNESKAYLIDTSKEIQLIEEYAVDR